MEVWKDIEDYEGLYQVSDLGRVKALNFKRTGEEKFLKQQTNYKGYLYVGLCKDGRQKFVRVHKLVAKAFVPNPKNLPQINHIDNDKKNNCASNLEWCTCAYNINYKYGQSEKLIQMALDGTVVKIWNTVQDAINSGYRMDGISRCSLGKIKMYRGYIWRHAK